MSCLINLLPSCWNLCISIYIYICFSIVLLLQILVFTANHNSLFTIITCKTCYSKMLKMLNTHTDAKPWERGMFILVWLSWVVYNQLDNQVCQSRQSLRLLSVITSSSKHPALNEHILLHTSTHTHLHVQCRVFKRKCSIIEEAWHFLVHLSCVVIVSDESECHNIV